MSAVEIIQAIAVTAELTQTQLSADAMKAMAVDLLANYDEPDILRALSRCRRELPGRLTQAAVVDRIEQEDGRPGGNEAWGIALAAFDESATVVINDEIGEAMAAARPVMECGDETGARMAFRESYDRIVRRNRASCLNPVWFPSLGTDPALRADAIKLAADRGLLTQSRAAVFLMEPMTTDDEARGNVIAGLLTGNTAPMPNDPEFQKHIEQLLATLKAGKS